MAQVMLPPRIWRTGAFAAAGAGTDGSALGVDAIDSAAAGDAILAASSPPALNTPICRSHWRRVRRCAERGVLTDRSSGAGIGVSSTGYAERGAGTSDTPAPANSW